jgi:hypothetical protein
MSFRRASNACAFGLCVLITWYNIHQILNWVPPIRPLPHQPPLVDQSDVVEQYVSTVIDDVMLREAIDATTTDGVLQQVAAFCSTTWPVNADALSADVRPFWHSRDIITVQNGLFLNGSRIIMLSSLRHETMVAFHAGHLGVVKCRSKARQSVWWPKIGIDIDRYVNSCQTCQHYARDRAEPLLSVSLPVLPWHEPVRAQRCQLRRRRRLLLALHRVCTTSERVVGCSHPGVAVDIRP